MRCATSESYKRQARRLRYVKKAPGGGAPNSFSHQLPPEFIVNLKPSLSWLPQSLPIAILYGSGRVQNPTALFICSAIGIIPLAGWMGRATEVLWREWAKGRRVARYVRDAAELIIAVIALSRLSGVVSVDCRSIIKHSLDQSLILCGGTKYMNSGLIGLARTSISLSLAAIALIFRRVLWPQAQPKWLNR
jgi:hypothetical protein